MNGNRPHFEPIIWPKWPKKIYGWIYFTIMALLTFSVCKTHVFWQHIKYDVISRRTINKRLFQFHRSGGKKCSSKLPDEFAIVFNGWSAGDTHHVAIFTTLPSERSWGIATPLLAMSPIGDEDYQGSKSPYAFFNFVITEAIKKLTNCISARVGNSCITKRPPLRKFDWKFVGCYSHWFNLAVRDYVKNIQHW